MKRLPTGQQNFKDIRENDLLYVDKTRQIHDLIQAGKLYFLSRPRRFGKSLLLSTLENIFLGNKELFKGLYIAERTNYDWKPYPVLAFNFAKLGNRVRNLEKRLQRVVQDKAKDFGITLEKGELAEQLEELVKMLNQKQGSIVVLIDEYDAPIVDFLNDAVQANKNREVIRDFFAPLKDLEYRGLLRFLFITGISKFSKVSLFSKFNNPTDLTLARAAKDLVGITQEELLANFKPHIQNSAEILDFSKEQLLEWLAIWYNGYSWDGRTRLYNPFSLLSFFDDSNFRNFWFATGTPTFLIETIRRRGVEPMKIENKKFYEPYFEKFTIETLDIYNLLFQTGYLTVKNRTLSMEGLEYELSYPNKEVRHSFIYNLLEAFTWQSASTVGDVVVNIKNALITGDVNTFIKQMKILLSNISYHLMPKKGRPKKEETKEEKEAKKQKLFEAWEGYFHTIIYLVTSFLGLSVQAEVTKHKGRLDLIAQTENYLYLMEFKLDETAEDAIQQIKDREYAAGYKNSPKTVILVGVNFSKEKRNIGTFESEEWR